MLAWLWRVLIGGCRHQYQLVAREQILSRPNGSFISIDTAGKYVTHELFTSQCAFCGKVITRKVDQVTGKVKCHKN